MHTSICACTRAVATGVVVALLLPVGFAAAQRPLRAWEVWCLDPNNRARVVATAQLNRSGSATGADRARIIPARSQEALDLPAWRQSHEADFATACRATFTAFREDAVTPDDFDRVIEKTTAEIGEAVEVRDDGLSKEAETGIATGTGLVTALIGLFGGYTLSKRSRADERRHAEADALDEELSSLEANVDALCERTLSGTARPADYMTTRQLAVHLRSKIPSSTKFSQQAKGSLTTLIEMLASPQREDPRDAEGTLRTAFDAVKRDVSALGTALRSS